MPNSENTNPRRTPANSNRPAAPAVLSPSLELLQQLRQRDDLDGACGVIHRVDEKSESVQEEVLDRLRPFVSKLDHCDGDEAIGKLEAHVGTRVAAVQLDGPDRVL